MKIDVLFSIINAAMLAVRIRAENATLGVSEHAPCG
jgi:isoprenylcysteine carboxyl methyltransferase (ICMT) family protein YpbQ